MSAELERSYRRALGWYPRGWRARNADVVAGTLLDVADAEHRTRPRRGELANLAASGISTRLGVLLEPRARNAISTIALATGVGYPLAHFAFQLWSPSGMAHASDWMFTAARGFNAIVNPGLLIAAVWLLALVLALVLTPRQRGLKPVIVLAIFASLALILANRIPGIGAEWYGLTTTSMVFLSLLGALVLIGTPARGLRLLLWTATTFGLFLGGYIGSGLLFGGGPINEHFFWDYLSRTLLPPLLGVAVLTAIALGIAGRTATAQTVIISTLPWAVVLLRVFGAQDIWNTLALLGIAAALVGFGALLPIAFRRARADVPSEGEQNMTSLP